MTEAFFDYELPERLIAQHPADRRDESRLLVVRRATDELEHRVFRELPDLLSPGDLLVLNDTKVLPARVLGHRESSGGQWQGLFRRTAADGLWEMMTKSRGHPVSGEGFAVEPGPFRLILRGRTPDHRWLMEPDPHGTPEELLAKFGQVPLPPYIRKGRAVSEDVERYQTVYAEHYGSVAAPTAGLHFTPEVLSRLAARNIDTARVTLHVGLGTFAPVKEEDPAKHVIHREWCELSEETVAAIRSCKERGGRVFAVGTTTTRTLESAARPGGLKPFRGETDLYVRPPFDFQVIDGMVTNFHLPRTTLLLMVAAFAGTDVLKSAYEEAVRREYRFYSYGDAMLIL
jgi:S-adenosylmethionine:tRNA ribosyltransferase-isomerase